MRTKTKKTKQITQIVVSMLLVLTMVFMPMKMILAADAQSSSTPTVCFSTGLFWKYGRI